MKRHLLWISEHASPLAALGGADGGGQNVYVAQIAQHLASAGCRVDILTRRDSPALATTVLLAEGLRVVHVPAGPAQPVRKEELLPFMDQFTAFALDYMRKGGRKYDVIHANFFMSALVAAELKRETGVPFVVTFHALGRVRKLHQGGADTFPEERLAIEDRAIAEADRIIAECAQDELDLVELYQADARKIATIPCGFDPGEFWPAEQAAARAQLGLPQHEPIILQLGRMVPRKGVDNVIRGLAYLRKLRGLSARLVIVGGEAREPDPALTPELGRLQAIAREEGVADAVTFVGSRGRQELRDYYNAADVFVSTPWYEPFGITPLEAMACGVPVVGSAVGGIKQTVRDGETGYLVPPDDPQSLAARLFDLLAAPDRRRVFSRQAIRHVNARYTWRSVARSVANLYENVLGTRKAVRAAFTTGRREAWPARTAAQAGFASAPWSSERDDEPAESRRAEPWHH